MQDVKSTAKNITIEALENSEKKRNAYVATSNYDAKNYLNVKLENGEDEKKIYIRIITIDKDSSSPFQHIHMHTVGVPKEISENGYKSYVCLNRTHGKYTEKLGTACPFCEERKHAYEKFTEYKEKGENNIAMEWRDRSLSMIPNEVSIIRCIERGKEDEGVKFWKFNLRSDEMDPEHQIRKLFNDKKEECEIEKKPVENILDIDTGYDLKVTVKRRYDKEGKPTNKTITTVSLFGSPKPLTDNPELRDKWLNDAKVWSDVFVAKPYDYLKVILDGDTPWFDRENNKWIKKMSPEEYKKKKEQEKSESERKADEQIKAAEKNAIDGNTQNTKNVNPLDEGDDGLPF